MIGKDFPHCLFFNRFFNLETDLKLEFTEFMIKNIAAKQLQVFLLHAI